MNTLVIVLIAAVCLFAAYVRKRQIFQRISYSPVFLYNRSRKIFRLFHYNYGG